MAKIGPKKKQSVETTKQEEPKQSAVDSVVSDVAISGAGISAEIQKSEPQRVFECFARNVWIYSENAEPRLLKAGMPMPEGCTLNPKTLKTKWTVDGYGKWSRG